MQNLFMFVLNPIYDHISSKLSIKTKGIIIFISFGLVFLMQALRFADIHVMKKMSYTDQAIICWILIFIVIVMSMDKKLKHIKANRVLMTLWMICGISIMIISFIHPVGSGFRALSVSMIIVFPCLWFVWGNRGDYNKLFNLFAKAIAFCGIAYLIWTVVTAPLDENVYYIGYYGQTNNPNTLGMICAGIFIASLYLTFSNRNNKTAIVYLLIGIVTNIVTLLSESRASILCNIMMAVIVAIFYLKIKISERKPSNNIKKVLKVMTIVCVLVCFSVIIIVSVYINENIITDSVAIGTEQDNVEDSDKTELLTKINRYSSGRIVVWQEYLKHMNLIGNNGNERLYIEAHGLKQWAHNTAIEIGYRTGIINGIIFLIIEIISVFFVIVYIFKRNLIEPHYVFVAMAVTAFCFYSLLEVVVFPFTKLPTFFYYMAIGMLFLKNQNVNR